MRDMTTEVTPAIKAMLDAHTTEDLFKLICAGLDKLDEKQLVEINRQAVNTVKFLRTKKTAEFAIGDKVAFDSARTGRTHYCVIQRIGSSIIWVQELRVDGTPKDKFEHPGFKVAPTMLRKAEPPPPPVAAPAPAVHPADELDSEPDFEDFDAPVPAPVAAAPEPTPDPGGAVPTVPGAGAW